ncbi:MAG: hypothetical protein VX589_16535 [Myxococcota bacterium]|nr:hypothetical protein [Myxococcota bacterium]
MMIVKPPEQLTRDDILSLSTALLDSRTRPNMLINVAPQVLPKLRLCGLSIVTSRAKSGDVDIYTSSPVPLTPGQSADVRRQVANHIEHLVPVGAAIRLSRVPCRIAHHAAIAFSDSVRTWSVPLEMPAGMRGYLMAHGSHGSAAGRLIVGELRLIASLMADAITRSHRDLQRTRSEVGLSLGYFSASSGDRANHEITTCIASVMDAVKQRFAELSIRKVSIDANRIILLCGHDADSADRLMKAVVAHVNILFPSIQLKASIVHAAALNLDAEIGGAINTPCLPSAPTTSEGRETHRTAPSAV